MISRLANIAAATISVEVAAHDCNGFNAPGNHCTVLIALAIGGYGRATGRVSWRKRGAGYGVTLDGETSGGHRGRIAPVDLSADTAICESVLGAMEGLVAHRFPIAKPQSERSRVSRTNSLKNQARSVARMIEDSEMLQAYLLELCSKMQFPLAEAAFKFAAKEALRRDAVASAPAPVAEEKING